MSLIKTMDLCTYSFIQTAHLNKKAAANKPTHHIYFLGHTKDQTKLGDLLLDWQYSQLKASSASLFHADGPLGKVTVIRPWLDCKIGRAKANINSPSYYSQSRDLLGKAFSELPKENGHSLSVDFFGLSDEQIYGALVGLEISSYKFKQLAQRKSALPSLFISKTPGKITAKTITKASSLGCSVNLARHLVNLPANILNPETYSEFISKLFKGSKSVSVEVWDKKRLKKENMNLLLSVGAASEHSPRLVRLSYRPRGAKGAPKAFVGKGVTFDTGGLNIKTGNYMRMMKKDMGGSASVAALCYWAEQSGLKKKCDFYLSLAENSVSDEAVRPGDIMMARNGLSIEMDNTDAEGRLVLADALDVAATASETPSQIINLATLTGATRVAVGYDVGGLYCNNTKLSEQLTKASYEMGDPLWALPLVQKYKSQLDSSVADMANSASGMGGGIRAALFLESFVKEIDWAHLDIYAWKNKAEGAYSEAGGSGQAVQCLADFLK